MTPVFTVLGTNMLGDPIRTCVLTTQLFGDITCTRDILNFSKLLMDLAVRYTLVPVYNGCFKDIDPVQGPFARGIEELFTNPHGVFKQLARLGIYPRFAAFVYFRARLLDTERRLSLIHI